MLSLLLALPKHKIKVFRKKLENSNLRIEAFDFPVLELETIDFELQTKDLEKFDYLVFSSSFGAQTFFMQIKNLPDNLQIVVIGPSIAEVLQNYNYKANFMPKIFNAENLGLELAQQNLINQKKFLIVSGEKTLVQKLEEIIQANNGLSKRLIVYRQKSIQEPLLHNLKTFLKKEQKLICLSSPEGVKCFAAILNKPNLNCPVLVLGPATQKEAQNLFPKAEIYLAPVYSYDGMLQFIKKHFAI